jgi:hypothetical protein
MYRLFYNQLLLFGLIGHVNAQPVQSTEVSENRKNFMKADPAGTSNAGLTLSPATKRIDDTIGTPVEIIKMAGDVIFPEKVCGRLRFPSYEDRQATRRGCVARQREDEWCTVSEKTADGIGSLRIVGRWLLIKLPMPVANLQQLPSGTSRQMTCARPYPVIKLES